MMRYVYIDQTPADTTGLEAFVVWEMSMDGGENWFQIARAARDSGEQPIIPTADMEIDGVAIQGRMRLAWEPAASIADQTFIIQVPVIDHDAECEHGPVCQHCACEYRASIRAAIVLCEERFCAGARLILQDALGEVSEEGEQYLPEWWAKADDLLLKASAE